MFFDLTRAIALLGIAGCLTWSAAAVAESDPDWRPGFLTGPHTDRSPHEVAVHYLRHHAEQYGLAAPDLADLSVAHRLTDRSGGTTHFYFRQRHNGLDVVNAQIQVNLSESGAIINASGGFVPDLRYKTPSEIPAISAPQAIRIAAHTLGLDPPLALRRRGPPLGPDRFASYASRGLSLEPIETKLVYHALSGDEVRLAWDLVIRPPRQSHWWNVRVDAHRGEPIVVFDWTEHQSYKVFAIPVEHPDDGVRTVEADVADALGSPFGWHDTDGAPGPEYTDTRGNNVFAQTDHDGDDAGGTRPDGGAELVFDFPLDLNDAPIAYQSAATTNLFYWTNLLHDLHYVYGFDEQSGNFQVNNYGRGGVAGDPLQADAQDGEDLRSATFATPPDGTAPRLQMYLWHPSVDHTLTVHDPEAVAGDYPAAGAEFGPTWDPSLVHGVVVEVNDGRGPPADGCETAPDQDLSGQIALIERGNCKFVLKVRHAQEAGAIGVIVANDRAGAPVILGDDGTGGDIAIPAIMIGQADGQSLRAELANAIHAAAQSNAGDFIRRDSDLDAGVIIHEYGHGVSTRLTGGPHEVTCLKGDESRGLGEGWSDFWALALTAKTSHQAQDPRPLSTYLNFEPPEGKGVRVFPYTTDLAVNPHTYQDVESATVPHGVGSVWAAILWEMYWELVWAHGFEPSFLPSGDGQPAGNTVALQLVMDGLKLQPCNPTFVDARDAMLLADQARYDGAHNCLLWRAFKKRGLGLYAYDGDDHNNLNVGEDFTLPPECGEPEALIRPIVSRSNLEEVGTEDGAPTDVGIEASRLAAGERYLILYSAAFGAVRTDAEVGVRLMYGDEVIARASGEGSSSGMPRAMRISSLHGLYVLTADGQRDLRLVFTLFSEAEAHVKGKSLIAIPLQHLTLGSDYWLFQDNSDEAVVTTATGFVDLLSYPVDLPETGDYLVLLSAEGWTPDGNSGEGEAFRVRINNRTQKMTMRKEWETNNASRAFSYARVHELDAGNNLFVLRVGPAQGTALKAFRRGRLLVLRGSAFDQLVFASHRSETLSTAHHPIYESFVSLTYESRQLEHVVVIGNAFAWQGEKFRSVLMRLRDDTIRRDLVEFVADDAKDITLDRVALSAYGTDLVAGPTTYSLGIAGEADFVSPQHFKYGDLIVWSLTPR